MPTSRFLLNMTRGMTGVISRIKLPAVVDPSSVSLVPRTAKSYSIWTVRIPTAATAQASSAFRQRPSLHISVHSTTRVKCLSYIESTKAENQGPSNQHTIPNNDINLITLLGIRQHLSSRQNHFTVFASSYPGNFFEPSESESESDYGFWAVRILWQRPTLFSTRLRSCCFHPSSPGVGELTECGVGRRAVTTPRPSRVAEDGSAVSAPVQRNSHLLLLANRPL